MFWCIIHVPGVMIPGYRYRASYKILSLTLYIVLDILLFSPHYAHCGLTATALMRSPFRGAVHRGPPYETSPAGEHDAEPTE